MKTSFKKRFSGFLFGLIAFAFMLSVGSLTPSNTAYAAVDSQNISISFINPGDKLLNNETEYSSNVLYNSETNTLYTSEGVVADIYVETAAQMFESWSVYNNSTKTFDVVSSTYSNRFSLKTLITDLYSRPNSTDYFTANEEQGLTLSLLSTKTEGNRATLNIPSSVRAIVDFSINGVEISSSVNLLRNTEYNVMLKAKPHYSLISAGIYEGATYIDSLDPSVTLTEGSKANFNTLARQNYNLYAECEKNTYTVTLKAFDIDTSKAIDVNAGDYFNVTSSSVKVGEAIADTITVDSTNAYAYNSTKAYNHVTNEYETIDLSAVFSSEMLSKYISNDQLEIAVFFDKLYAVNLSASAGGSYVVYINDAIQNEGVALTSTSSFYLKKSDKIEVVALPDAEKVFDGFTNANDKEVSSNHLTLTNLTEDRNINVSFDREYFNVNIFAVDVNEERLYNLDQNTSLYVNKYLSHKLRVGDRLTSLVHVDNTADRSHRFVRYEIYNKSTTSWQNYVLVGEGDQVNTTFVENYVVGNNKEVFIRAVYERVFNVKIGLQEFSKGAGYFDVDILRVDSPIPVNSYENLTSFNDYIPSGYIVQVTAYAYNGFEFDSFNTLNQNPIDKNILKKTVKVEDISFLLSFAKSTVELNLNDKSNKVDVENVEQTTVQIGDVITLPYKLYTTREFDKVLINGKNAKDLDNVKVTSNSIVITITREFLQTLNDTNDLQIEVKTTLDASVIIFGVIIPVLIALMIAGAVTVTVLYVKSKKQLEKLSKETSSK